MNISAVGWTYIMNAVCLVALISVLLRITIAEDPLVTLDHGGQLRGKKFDYDGLNIDLFLGKFILLTLEVEFESFGQEKCRDKLFSVITGVPYAEPPTGSLRFEKPKPAQSWSGVRDALTVGNVCPQRNMFTGIYTVYVYDRSIKYFLSISLQALFSITLVLNACAIKKDGSLMLQEK